MDKDSSSRIKKRKTRKCLDELRKKSRLCSNLVPNIAETNIRDGHKKRSITGSQGNKVTRNRLTMKLGIFSKGVRSETITRPHLSEEFKARMDENLYKIIDLANGRPSHTVTSGAYEENLMRTNESRLHEQVVRAPLKTMNEIHKSQPVIKMETANSQSLSKQHSPGISQNSSGTSPMCFTPPNQGISKTHPQRPNLFLNGHLSENHIITIDSSSESKDSSVDGELYQYFKEFMADIPEYLSIHLPELMEDDTYESTREYLQRLHIRSCERENEDNVRSSISREGFETKKKSILEKTMEQSILLNPIEYIKHCGQQNQYPIMAKEYATTSIPASSLNQRPLAHTSFGSFNHSSNNAANLSMAGDSKANLSFLGSIGDKNSATADSSDSNMVISAGNHCVASLIEESPEIRFYPRKLNP